MLPQGARAWQALFGRPEYSERDWLETVQDSYLTGGYAAIADALSALLPSSTRRLEVPSPRQPEPPLVPAWTPEGLLKAVRKLRARPKVAEPQAGKAYAFPPNAERFIKARDITCLFPGCTRLAWDCENDHIIEWPAGPTAVWNAASACKHHHDAKHHYFTVTRLPSGTLRWTTPTGLSVDRPPRPLLRSR